MSTRLVRRRIEDDDRACCFPSLLCCLLLGCCASSIKLFFISCSEGKQEGTRDGKHGGRKKGRKREREREGEREKKFVAILAKCVLTNQCCYILTGVQVPKCFYALCRDVLRNQIRIFFQNRRGRPRILFFLSIRQ